MRWFSLGDVKQNLFSINSFSPAWGIVDHYFLFLQFLLTPLHLACWYGQESVVKLLLQHGADVNAADRVSLKNTFSLAFAHDSGQRKV